MKYIVGNWKQNKSIQESLAWLEDFKSADIAVSDDTQIYVAAPFTALAPMREYIDTNGLSLSLAAQDIAPRSSGAYTGEVGIDQLEEIVDGVIIGHSERRMYFGETNDFVSHKVEQVVSAGLRAFVCVADQVLQTGQVPRQKVDVDSAWFASQLTSVFNKIQKAQRTNVVLVYEPISAISTFGGEPLTSGEATAEIEKINNIVGDDVAVMYGGSVNPDNIMTYWPEEKIAGVMPGGASLDIDKFSSIISQTQEV